MTGNPIVFWELASNDADRSAEFLRRVFDWDIRYSQQLGFHEAPIPEPARKLSSGYIFTLKRARLPFLTLYVQVEDIVARAKLVEEAGGLVIEPPHPIPGGSWICLFNDPCGVTLAMIQAGKAGEE